MVVHFIALFVLLVLSVAALIAAMAALKQANRVQLYAFYLISRANKREWGNDE